MNQWLQQLQGLLGNGGKRSTAGGEGLSKMLAPGALGGLAGLLIANKSSRKLLSKYGKNALIVGGGAVAGTVLWNKYKQRISETHRDEPQFGQRETPVDHRAERLLTALVFAAKSDGHIDARERQAIDDNLRQIGLGDDGERLVRQAMDRPLDPDWLARGVSNEEEALELWFLSCAAIDVDHFMERSYLNALGDALKIPADVRRDIERDLRQQRATVGE
ncbi:tellurite resistance TerB family protein [Pantoea sp. 1.19]|uniref:tellurite resistance TerB family protein n=1 Tax=Pantoea sp. 1.19 TaxID=1925589 RepID=UPI00094897F8|nr:DUF533 domain-containing protein [Pantoea sp. 1.19]